MVLIILLIIVVVAIVIIKKKRKAKEESAPVVMNENANPISFFAETKNEIAEQKSKCQAFINSNEELTKIYNQIYDTFIPKKDGNYKGALSGLLGIQTRCKRLAKAHESVKEICKGNSSEYNAFFTTLYDCILNDLCTSRLPKLSNATNDVLKDYENGNNVVCELGFNDALTEFLANPTSEKHEIKVDTDSLFKKITFIAKRKKGEVIYEINNVYYRIRQGYNLLDPLMRAAEVLLIICNLYEYPDVNANKGGASYSKETIEKYNIPNVAWYKQESNA